MREMTIKEYISWKLTERITKRAEEEGIKIVTERSNRPTITMAEHLRENNILDLINKGRRKRGEPEIVMEQPKPELVVDNVPSLEGKTSDD